jgi:hypothetical protein
MKNVTKILDKRRETGKMTQIAEKRSKRLKRSISILKAARAKVLHEHGDVINLMHSQEVTRSGVNPSPYDQYAYMGRAAQYKQSLLDKRPLLLFLPENEYNAAATFTLTKAPYM